MLVFWFQITLGSSSSLIPSSTAPSAVPDNMEDLKKRLERIKREQKKWTDQSAATNNLWLKYLNCWKEMFSRRWLWGSMMHSLIAVVHSYLLVVYLHCWIVISYNTLWTLIHICCVIWQNWWTIRYVNHFIQCFLWHAWVFGLYQYYQSCS